MFLKWAFDRFAEKSPVTVMTRALMEHAFDTKALDALFGEHAERQWEKKLLFSSLVDLMSLVVCRVEPSVKKAYMAMKDTLPVSLTAVYSKLNGMEEAVIAEMVRYMASRLAPVIEAMGGQLPSLIPGYQTMIIDGNHLASTDHRLAVLRLCKAAPLPGHALVILNPDLRLAVDMIPCEDAHAQERSLFSKVLSMVKRMQCWIGDRNFCTAGFLQGIIVRGAYFIIRQHANLRIDSYGTLRSQGRCSNGAVFEQTVTIPGEDGQPITLRRIVLKLDVPTREGNTEIAILTNLPTKAANAARIAELYHERWTIERLFHTLTQILDGEKPSLGYPGAALFNFAVALVSYNIAATLRAALRAQFGHERVEADVSWHYIAHEVRKNSSGMEVTLDETVWTRFQSMSPQELGREILSFAAKVRLDNFPLQKRGPKKPPPKRTEHADESHVSTARLLEQAGLH